MDKIVILGSGGHAKSCADVIESTGKYQIAGYIHNDEDSKLKGDISYRKLHIEDGAKFEGQCDLTLDSESENMLN